MYVQVNMQYYFPQHIIEKYSDHSHNDIFTCYENAAIDMVLGESHIFIWGNKVVHRNTIVDETTVHYSGQAGRKTKDKMFDALIHREMSGYFFLKRSYEHVCYKIVSCSLLTERGDKDHPPTYELKIKKIAPTNYIKIQYPEYYDNIHLHPTACVKLQSMTDYGFIPESFGKEMTNGIFYGFKAINLSEDY